MGLWNSTLVYVGARTLLAAAILLFVLRRFRGPWFLLGQSISDLSCAALLLGYVDPDVRDDIGVLVLPLLAFVVGWEVRRFRAVVVPRDETEDDAGSPVTSAFLIYGIAWTVGFVVPALAAGGFLVFDVLAPRQWPFPNPRPPLVCTPTEVDSGEAVTLRMTVPHGPELTIFRPDGGTLVVIPFTSYASRPPGSRGFGDVDRLTLRTDTTSGRATPGATPERVFVDSGLYLLRVSEVAETNPSLVCRVRYTAAAPPR